mgnify:FL=1|tara:strand:- start:108 stop:347 length:240 start_codon:yes stop_codon:yes gene_type:complete
MELDKRVEFGPSKYDPNTFVPTNWYLGNEEVTELKYHGLTDKTTIEDLGPEPADFSEFIEWEIKKTLIQKGDGLGILNF